MGLPTPATTMDDFVAKTNEIIAGADYREPEIFGLGWAYIVRDADEVRVLDGQFECWSILPDSGRRSWAIMWPLIRDFVMTDGFIRLGGQDVYALIEQFSFLEGDGQVHENFEALKAMHYDTNDAPQGYIKVPVIAAFGLDDEHVKDSRRNRLVEMLVDILDHEDRKPALEALTERIRGNVTDPDQGVVNEAFEALNTGLLRPSEILNGDRIVVPEAKMAVLQMFASLDMRIMPNGLAPAWDKVPFRFEGWSVPDFDVAGIRVVPGSDIRDGCYLGRGSVFMFGAAVNSGAFLMGGDGTMIDRGAGLGACSWTGRRVHMGANSGSGGVLSPSEAAGCVQGDDTFVAPLCEFVSGLWLKPGVVLTGGTFISASSKVFDCTTGTFLPEDQDWIPAGAVVVMGVPPHDPKRGAHVIPRIVKYRDIRTDAALEAEAVLHEF